MEDQNLNVKKSDDLKDCKEALRNLLVKGIASTQDEICLHLEKMGYKVNQSKISRMLRRLGVSKSKTIDGKIVYRLPRDPAPPSHETKLSDLIIDIVHNDNLIVIFTSPGSASMISRVIDFQEDLGVLGTIAGDDTIFIAICKNENIEKCYAKIKKLLMA